MQEQPYHIPTSHNKKTDDQQDSAEPHTPPANQAREAATAPDFCGMQCSDDDGVLRCTEGNNCRNAQGQQTRMKVECREAHGAYGKALLNMHHQLPPLQHTVRHRLHMLVSSR